MRVIWAFSLVLIQQNWYQGDAAQELQKILLKCQDVGISGMKYAMQNQNTVQKKKKRRGINGTAPEVADARLAVDSTMTDMTRMSLMERF